MSTDEYTPTLDELRDEWVDSQLNPLPREIGVPLVPEYQARFDRAIAAHDAEVARQTAQKIAEAIKREAWQVLSDDSGEQYERAGMETAADIAEQIGDSS